MIKCLLAAGIVRDIEFISTFALDRYLNAMHSKWPDFKILDRFDLSDGRVIVRLLTPYNNCDLIQL